MGRRSRYITQRKFWLRAAMRAHRIEQTFNDPPDDAYMPDAEYKAQSIKLIEEMLSLSFKDSRRPKQTATVPPQKPGLFNRRTWRYMQRHPKEVKRAAQ